MEAIADYYLFAKEFGIKPWELDRMDLLTIDGMKTIHNARVEKEEAEAKKLRR